MARPIAPPRLHEIEQAARVGNTTGVEMTKRQSRRRQQAKHDRGAANDLRPEHRVEIGHRRLTPAQCEPQSEQAEAEGGQQLRIDALLQRHGERRDEQLRDPVASMILPISNASCSRTKARKTGMR